MSASAFDLTMLVPGGILPDDHVHHITNDRTCSRCRWAVPDGEVPIMLWTGKDNEDLLIYCETCLSMPAKAAAAADGPTACTMDGRLADEQSQAVRRLAERVTQYRERQTEMLPDGAEVYAYPHAGGIAWGVNSGATGQCIARGVCGRTADA
jgi:hypothetical protein